jgi:GAF domain-containing protein
MLNQPSSATNQTSQEREERRRQLLQRLRGEADAILERLADELIDLPDDQVFGAIEYTLRDLGHDLASRAHQAGVDAGKKRGTQAPASAAPTARPTPGSSATGRRPS